MPPSVRYLVDRALFIALPPGVAAWQTLKAGFVFLGDFLPKRKKATWVTGRPFFISSNDRM
jgi:hypothetical protein